MLHFKSFYIIVKEEKEEDAGMTGQKVDKRIARTKTRLKEGLADLMTEKSIQEITVKELVAHVHINRSTFYLHYSDISNMLENVKQELIEEIAEVMETYPPEPFSEQSVLFMKDIFFSLGRNRKLYRSLMGENGDPAFVQEVEDLVGEKCLTGLKRQFPNEMNVLKYSYRFCLSGCVGLIRYWLQKDPEESETPEEMADIAFRFIMSVIRDTHPRVRR